MRPESLSFFALILFVYAATDYRSDNTANDRQIAIPREIYHDVYFYVNEYILGIFCFGLNSLSFDDKLLYN